VHPRAGDRALPIVYTPLHGVGDALACTALAEAGFAQVTSVPEQRQPDGAFPTVAFPNPEEPGTMDLAFALARETGAALVLANDPDADRLAVAVPSHARAWRQLTGNEVGVLLGHYLLTEKPSPKPRAVVTSIVSSPLLGRIAASLGARCEETLTGFKWIANRAMELEHEGYEVVLGYEEALGYCVGDAVRDKDGISAAALVAEMTAVLRERGRTLEDELDAIAQRWGVYASGQVNVTASAASLAAMMDRLRGAPPAQWGGDPVVALVDYASRAPAGEDVGVGAGVLRARPDLPPSNVLAFHLASGSRVIARPSGTEPKAKFYFDVREGVGPGEPVALARVRAGAVLARLEAALDEIVPGST
jgi:phosphomannomutase